MALEQMAHEYIALSMKGILIRKNFYDLPS